MGIVILAMASVDTGIVLYTNYLLNFVIFATG